MRAPGKLFEVERDGLTVILTPRSDLGELEYQAMEGESGAVLRLLEGDSPVRNVVLDFCRIDYFGSTALGFFVRLWRRVQARSGRMALCNVSEQEMDILHVTRLDGLWPTYPSRAEAVRAVNEPPAAPPG